MASGDVHVDLENKIYTVYAYVTEYLAGKCLK